MSVQLKREFDYYLSNQSELVKKHNGNYIVIVGNKVIGSYKDEMEAIKETTKNHELGTFLIQYCESGSDSYTQTFHSRVVFA